MSSFAGTETQSSPDPSPIPTYTRNSVLPATESGTITSPTGDRETTRGHRRGPDDWVLSGPSTDPPCQEVGTHLPTPSAPPKRLGRHLPQYHDPGSGPRKGQTFRRLLRRPHTRVLVRLQQCRRTRGETLDWVPPRPRALPFPRVLFFFIERTELILTNTVECRNQTFHRYPIPDEKS